MSIYTSLPPMKNRLGILAALALLCAMVVSCTPTSPQVAGGSGDGVPPGAHKTEPANANTARHGGVAEVKIDQTDATYVGRKICEECHAHAAEHADQGAHVKAFTANPRSSQQGEVCEACHGPGSKHAKDTLNRAYIIGYTRDWGTPVQTQNAQCLSCHQGGQRLYWVQSTHDTNGVACSDCHNPMLKNSVTGALLRASIAQTCYTCHPQQRAEFLRRSHMPVPEGKMSCEDCHNPHGSPTRPLLKADTINEVCYACHAEKRGPFIWEHAPVRENCATCHLPHGSNNDKLLITSRPMLCQQCHQTSGHVGQFYNGSESAAAALLPGGLQSPRAIGRSCQNCHVQIHGSNHPAGARFQR